MRYTISGDNMPVAICELDDGESLYCEAGAMSWMSPNMVMETKSKGGLGGFFGRAISGESGFQNYYTAKNGNGRIAFSSAYVGNIQAVEVTPDKPIIIQKRAFLAATMGVNMEVFFQKKLGTALFGGEGFVMQKLSGSGIVFLELDGSIHEYELQAGEQMLISTGHLAMMEESVTMDIQQIKGVKNVLFGGESLFNTVITGPGRVILQTRPASAFAVMLGSLIPGKNG